MTITRKDFPPDFVWGSAISSYQTEGGWDADGKGKSIWDVFCATPGAVKDGDTGNIACDSYHRYKEDIHLLSELGVTAFRFSLCWPRILPNGVGEINQAGVDFYKSYMDELLRHGIKPWVTLYHWDLPQALEDKGGWQNPEIIDWFKEYCRVVHEQFGDYLHDIVLINEPSMVSFFGYGVGIHAPGIADKTSYLRSAHHVNRCIYEGYHTLKNLNPSYNVGSSFATPYIRNAHGDDDAAHIFNCLWNLNYQDPVMLGTYPEAFASEFATANPDTIHDPVKTPLDFVGLQYYGPIFCQRVEPTEMNFYGVWFTDGPESYQKNALGWSIDAEDLRRFILSFQSRYGQQTPLYITENGSPWDDAVSNGQVHDPERIAYFEDHLAILSDLTESVKGYFYWSFMDNFEWADGYHGRFGLVYVDFDSLERTPKDSFFWYKGFLAAP